MNRAAIRNPNEKARRLVVSLYIYLPPFLLEEAT
jgi:hypothetical protein